MKDSRRATTKLSSASPRELFKGSQNCPLYAICVPLLKTLCFGSGPFSARFRCLLPKAICFVCFLGDNGEHFSIWNIFYSAGWVEVDEEGKKEERRKHLIKLFTIIKHFTSYNAELYGKGNLYEHVRIAWLGRSRISHKCANFSVSFGLFHSPLASLRSQLPNKKQIEFGCRCCLMN